YIMSQKQQCHFKHPHTPQINKQTKQNIAKPISMIAQTLLQFRAYAIPQSQAYEFATSLEAKKCGVHLATVVNHEAAQHFYLLRFTGSVQFKRNMLGQLLNCLSVVPVFLCFWHYNRVG